MEEIPEHEGYKFRVARPRTDFRGTHQYASPNAHMLIELGRHDDIWSLMYMVAESFVELPWTRCEETEVEHYMNQSTILRLFSDEKNPTRLNADMRRQLDEIDSMLKASKYYDSPNYDAVYQFFKDSMAKAKVTWDTPFDWEIGNTLSEETSKGVKRKMGGPWENPGLFFTVLQ
nr:hypothetical protein AC8.2 - Caenorhabditis elegans [Caenorhabditis elegans]